jgi:hypothetical protein
VLHPQGAQDKVSPAPAGRGGAAPTLAYDSDEEKGEKDSHARQDMGGSSGKGRSSDEGKARAAAQTLAYSDEEEEGEDEQGLDRSAGTRTGPQASARGVAETQVQWPLCVCVRARAMGACAVGPVLECLWGSSAILASPHTHPHNAHPHKHVA